MLEQSERQLPVDGSQFPVNEKTDFTGKRVVFIRGGMGLGDMIQCTPVLSRIKAAGAAQLDVWCWPQVEQIIKHNPHVDAVHFFDPKINDESLSDEERNTAANDLNEHLKKNYDHLCYLGFSVEGKFVFKTTFNGAFSKIGLNKERREKAAGVNLYEEMIRRAGLERDPQDRLLPEFYFSDEEEKEFLEFAQHKGKQSKWILWNPTGSTQNKCLPHTAYFIKKVLEAYPDSRHFMVGAINSDINDSRVHIIGMQWGLRKLFSFMRAMDLVVAPDSAVLNAAGAFPVSKIGYFTHSEPDSILKHFQNAGSVSARCDCSPCHLIPVDYQAVWEHPVYRRNARTIYKYCMTYDPNDMYQPLAFRCILSIDIHEFERKIINALKKGAKHEQVYTQQRPV